MTSSPHTDVAATPAPAEAGPDLTYRPHLDGLRAVAVYLVVLFHAGSSWFSGGYIGVDVFFVLSGFLVTRLLLRDIARSGAISYGRFYSRRFRRLLPAAFVALTVTAVVYAAIASPAEALAAIGSFKAAFLYSTNWYFIHQSTGYFGANISANPVLHFWSLAVEEQFYLLWPLLLGGLYAVTRRFEHDRQLRAIRTTVLVAALASAVWALSLRNVDPNRAYYGTDTRAYELLAGALLALTPAIVATAKRHARATRASALLGGAALLVVASSWITVDAITRGVAITVATCVLIVALEAADTSVVKRVLSTPTAVYLGKISYGTYLWHWLVILVLLRNFHTSALSTIGITAFIATGLASLSFAVLEHPIRTSTLLDRHRRTVIVAGLTVSALSAVALIPAIVNPANSATPTIRSSATVGFTPVPANPSWRDAKDGSYFLINCLHRPVSKCTLVHGTGPSILLMGDSHAWMLIPTFVAIARADNLTLSVSVKGACPWQQDLYVHPTGDIGAKGPCKAEKDDLYNRVIPALHPDVIVTMNLGYEDPELGLEGFLGPGGKVMTPGTREYTSWIDTTTRRSLAKLRTDAKKVVLVEPIPMAPTGFDPLACLSKAKVLEQCRYVARATPDPLELFYRSLAKSDPDVFDLDLDREVCPYLPICDPIVNNQIVKWDRTHLTAKFAASIAPDVDAYLKRSGVILG